MSFFIAAVLLLLAASGAAVVFTRDPRHQVLVAGVHGLLLTALFFSLLAPDVAISQIVVGTVGLPMLIFLTLVKVRGRPRP